MRKIILVSGFAGSGKDLLADFIVSKSSFVKYAIADELKFMTSYKYNFDHILTLTQDGKKTIVSNGKTVRQLLIDEAIHQRKIYGPNVFIANTVKKICVNTLHKGEAQRPSIIISDFRFLNEYKYICCVPEFVDAKIITVRINRFNESPVKSDSETQLNDFKFDYTLDNKGTIPEFYNLVAAFLSSL